MRSGGPRGLHPAGAPGLPGATGEEGQSELANTLSDCHAIGPFIAASAGAAGREAASAPVIAVVLPRTSFRVASSRAVGASRYSQIEYALLPLPWRAAHANVPALSRRLATFVPTNAVIVHDALSR